MMKSIIQILRERLLIQDMTDPELEKILSEKQITLYIGFDPTADSLHIGNMVSILVLKHFQMAGHNPIALVGGGTGMIGDPSGRSSERNLLDQEQLQKNLEGIRKSLGTILDFEGENACQIVNNGDWLGKIGFVDFLRDVGKYFRLGDMLSKDSVKSRLNSDSGMSFTEFSYQLLQAYDFKYLSEHYDCSLQGGGSDQWGNITAGTDLIRRTLNKPAFGITTPLLVDSDGKKMGKSVGGAIWLNDDKLSPYEFYQFWIRQADPDMERFMKMLTLMELEVIDAIIKEHQIDPGKRVAQKRLAFELTSLVHGEDEANKAREASEALFGGALSNKTDEELKQVFNDVPSVQIARSELEAGLATLDLVVSAKLAASKKEARRLLTQNGLYLNNSDDPLDAEMRTLTPENLASESMLIMRAGKKKYCLIQFV